MDEVLQLVVLALFQVDSRVRLHHLRGGAAAAVSLLAAAADDRPRARVQHPAACSAHLAQVRRQLIDQGSEAAPLQDEALRDLRLFGVGVRMSGSQRRVRAWVTERQHGRRIRTLARRSNTPRSRPALPAAACASSAAESLPLLRCRRHAHASCSEAQTTSNGECKQQHEGTGTGDAQGDALNEGERRQMTWRDAPCAPSRAAFTQPWRLRRPAGWCCSRWRTTRCVSGLGLSWLMPTPELTRPLPPPSFALNAASAFPPAELRRCSDLVHGERVQGRCASSWVSRHSTRGSLSSRGSLRCGAWSPLPPPWTLTLLLRLPRRLYSAAARGGQV